MNNQNNILGKFEDAGQIVQGGRIDRHWNGEIDLNPQYYVGTSQVFDADWLHDTQKALEHFNLRSIEFGNWLNQEERANFLYASMLSLHHLALMLGVSDERIGLGKRLSISLGARGRGNAAGHYEPNPYAVINITKTAGIGVLAHEWGHAIDNLISFHTKSHQTYVSGGRTTRKYFDEEVGKKGNYYEKQFEEFFNILFYDVDGEKSKFHEKLDKLDDYWNRRNEIFARTFEVYIAEKLRLQNIKNHFLVSGINPLQYPSVEKMQEVSRYIGNIVAKGLHITRENGLSGVSTPTGYDGFRKTLKQNSSLADTLENMQRIARRDTYQVQGLASELEGNSVEDTASNIWHYLRENTRYKLDRNGFEELRTPARSLHDGKLGLNNKNYGIDCDDYTILISALLLNLGIEHEYRVAAYKKKGKFQHIYPVAFDELGNEYVIDCVPEIPHFNYEAQPIIDLKIIPMELQELSGLGSLEQETAAEMLEDLQQPFSLSGVDAEVDDDIIEENFLSGFAVVDDEEEADFVLSGAEIVDVIDKGLIAELHKARLSLLKEKKAPTILSKIVDVDSEVAHMDDVIDSWNTDEREDAILDAINSKSAYSNFFRALLHSSDALSDEDTLNGLEDEEIYLARTEGEEIDGLGLFRKLRSKISSTVKKVSSGVKTVVKKAGTTVKKAVKAVVRYNPATIALRNAALLVLKINLFGFSEKLIYGYLSESQAQSKGVDLSEWRKVVNVKNQVEKYFEKIGGKPENVRSAIVKGKAAKKTGLSLNGLGVVATSAAAGTAAASPFIVFVKKLIGSINPAKLFKSVKNLVKKKQPDGSVVEVPASEVTYDEAGLPADEFNFDDAGGDYGSSNGGDSSGGGMMDKVKSFFTTHKKKIMIGTAALIAILIAVVTFNKYKKKKKRQLAGLKAARTRKRNQKLALQGAPKRTYTRKKAAPKRRKKQLGRGSTTIIKHPTKGKGKARMSIRSSGDRFRMMHQIAKDLQKKHPKTKYSTLLSRASKQLG